MFDLSAQEKQSQRKTGIAARRALSEEVRGAANASLCAHIAKLEAFRHAHTILAYAAFGGEADLDAALALAARQGKLVAYPVCGEQYSMTAAVPDADGWEIGRYGIRTPLLAHSRIVQPEHIDLVLAPCTAFDETCMRVGMGKGYYDRYLPRCVNAVKVGVAFEVQKVGQAAADPYDQRLDAFVTERGVYTWK